MELTGLEKRIGGRPSKRPNINEFAMLRSGMTNKQLAEHYGVSVPTVRGWLRAFQKEATNGTKED